jgi:hypothetical protein
MEQANRIYHGATIVLMTLVLAVAALATAGGEETLLDAMRAGRLELLAEIDSNTNYQLKVTLTPRKPITLVKIPKGDIFFWISKDEAKMNMSIFGGRAALVWSSTLPEKGQGAMLIRSRKDVTLSFKSSNPVVFETADVDIMRDPARRACDGGLKVWPAEDGNAFNLAWKLGKEAPPEVTCKDAFR